MRFHRIWAVVLRNMYVFRESFDRLSDIFYWPIIDLILWGITSVYFKSLTVDTVPITMMIVSGIIFWTMTRRVQMEMSLGILEDLWNRNLVNLFVAPLKVSEWIAALLGIGLLKALISGVFATFVGYLLYKVGILAYGWYLGIFIFLLALNGIWLGFLVSGLLLRFGTKVQAFTWSTIFILAPFSAVFYPVSILPYWAQIIAKAVPTSYVFEAGRELLFTGKVDLQKFIISMILSIFYTVLTYKFFTRSFKKVLERGLVNLY